MVRDRGTTPSRKLSKKLGGILLIRILLAFLVLVIIILFSNIRLTLKINQSNAKLNGYVCIKLLGLFKITKEFDEKTLRDRDKNSGRKKKNIIVKWLCGENIWEYYGKKDILFNSLLHMFKIVEDKVSIYNLELSADYCLNDAAATSISYGVLSGILGMFTSVIENKQVVKRKFSIKIMPHFCNNTFLNTSLLCIFNIKLGNIIITGIRIFMYLNRIKKEIRPE